MNITLNKKKSIGKVLYIVEGGKTEPYILHRIFTKIFDYQVETILQDKEFISHMLSLLTNSRDNNGYERQGILLLSYPSIESFTLSCFRNHSFELKFDTGHNLKQYLQDNKINQKNIWDDALRNAVKELFCALTKMNIADFNVDDFGMSNRDIFEFEENMHSLDGLYGALNLICVSLIDLGLIEA